MPIWAALLQKIRSSEELWGLRLSKCLWHPALLAIHRQLSSLNPTMKILGRGPVKILGKYAAGMFCKPLKPSFFVSYWKPRLCKWW